jgi:phosphoglycolate phosphatase
MKYKLVVFDFDGTLADSFSWFLETLNSVAGKYRFKRIEPHEIECLRGLSVRELMAHLRLSRWKVPLLAADMRRRMADGRAAIKLFDGVERMLERLAAQGIELAVLTSNSQENVRRILGARNAALVRHFECGASIFGKEAKFRKLLRRTGAAPADVLCIGDEIRDAQAAAAAGLAFAGVAWGYARPDVFALHCAGALFVSVDELADALCAG